MVIPIAAHAEGSVRDLPDEAQVMVPCLKVCIIILWLLGIASLLARDVLFAITMVAPAVMGTFLLPEDRHLSVCYEHLRNFFGTYCCSIVGLSNLAPFFVISTVNAMFLGFNLAILLMEWRVNKFLQSLHTNPLQIIKMLAFVTQLSTSLMSYRMLKLVPLGNPFDDESQGDFYEGLPGLSTPWPQHVRQPSDLASDERTSDRASANSDHTAFPLGHPLLCPEAQGMPQGMPQRFQPFAGQGHKLSC